MRYPLIYTPDDNGTLLVTSLDFPEVTSFGEDEADASIHGADAIVTAIAGRIARRESVPKPSPIEAGAPLAVLSLSDHLKIEVYWAMQIGGVGKADLARRLQCHLPQVDRLLDLLHASKLDQLDNALRAVGCRVSINVEAA